MLILEGTIANDITIFSHRLSEETLPCSVITYTQYLNESTNDCHPPCGIIYMRISPHIAFARIQKRNMPSEISITLHDLEQIYKQHEQLFIEGQHLALELNKVPLLVLNGNVDFQTDFSQFYNHLFYIKRFLKTIKEREDIARGIYKEKVTHRHCC
jgi:deoxyadenosine/deoxycytidine kinase